MTAECPPHVRGDDGAGAGAGVTAEAKRREPRRGWRARAATRHPKEHAGDFEGGRRTGPGRLDLRLGMKVHASLRRSGCGSTSSLACQECAPRRCGTTQAGLLSPPPRNRRRLPELHPGGRGPDTAHPLGQGSRLHAPRDQRDDRRDPTARRPWRPGAVASASEDHPRLTPR